MGILKDKAEALRLLATKLEQLGNDFPKQAKEVIRNCAPKDGLLTYTQRMDLYLANDPSFVQHCIERAGAALGRDISKNLAATFKGLRKPDYNDPFCRLGREQIAEYEVGVVVLTPKQLEDLVQQALEIGRASAALGDRPKEAPYFGSKSVGSMPFDPFLSPRSPRAG